TEIEDEGAAYPFISAGIVFVGGIGFAVLANVQQWAPNTRDYSTVGGVLVALLGAAICFFIFPIKRRHYFTRNGQQFLEVSEKRPREFDVISHDGTVFANLKVVKSRHVDVFVGGQLVAKVTCDPATFGQQQKLGNMILAKSKQLIAKMTDNWTGQLAILPEADGYDPRLILATWQVFRSS
ncbi:MAG: hypothetical protein JWM11_6773, partial [Planctomycetaceae bacterium]|nr:hypothetical protein [Planctomycetaceae bacterium]